MSTLVSIDLDDVRCYHQVHGLEAPDDAQSRIVLERCLPRFLELFEKLPVRATFFVIGRDLQRDLDGKGVGARLLGDAYKAGHELGNHSHAHAYDMVTWTGGQIAADVARCDSLLRSLGAAPRGFRAPGYTHDFAMLLQVAALGYRYDSSSLPSPAYYLAKLGAQGYMRLRGKKSRSLSAGARSFVGSVYPHYMPEVGMWEVPISVTRMLRLPLVGTFLLSGPDAVNSRLRNEARDIEHLHIELHGLDLADPETDGFSAELRARQPELQTPLAVRLERLESLLRERGGAQTIGAALR